MPSTLAMPIDGPQTFWFWLLKQIPRICTGNCYWDQCSQCKYCNKIGHIQYQRCQLYECPCIANITQSLDTSDTSEDSSQHIIILTENCIKLPSCLLILLCPHRSYSLFNSIFSTGLWSLDFRASDHIWWQKSIRLPSILSKLSLTLKPTVPKTLTKGIGLASPLPIILLTFVLFVPKFLFILLSISKITRTLNCHIIFFDKSVTLEDRVTGKMTDIRYESLGSRLTYISYRSWLR